jgi:exosortase F-associated protein
MHRFLKIVAVLIAVVGLVLVRSFENEMFYDPLLIFFKTDHTIEALPAMQHIKLVLSTLVRFLVNSGLSLLILWFLFDKVSILKFSAMLYFLLGATLLLVFALLINYIAIFYVRRFLIQPLFLLILVPAFYIQNRK